MIPPVPEPEFSENISLEQRTRATASFRQLQFGLIKCIKDSRYDVAVLTRTISGPYYESLKSFYDKYGYYVETELIEIGTTLGNKTTIKPNSEAPKQQDNDQNPSHDQESLHL